MKDVIKKYKDAFIIMVLVLLASILMFNNLGASYIQDWDEARHAENALEILKTNDWIVINYGGTPDLWNLKPPLGAWLIAISFKVFGTTAFALRFWSVIFGIGTIILVYLFGREMSNRLVGFMASIILLITPAFLMDHAVRTGNYDSPLTFFVVLSLYLFYLYEKSEKPKLLIFTSISIALGIMIKGVVGLFPLFIIFAYAIFTKSFVKIIKKREFFYSMIPFFLIIFPWVILRFIRGREFFIKMINYDILYRSSEFIEGHTSSLDYYFKILENTFGPILYLLLIASFLYSVFLIFKKDKNAFLLVSWTSFFLVIFTIAKTRLFWYIIPIYPALSLLIGYFLYAIKKKFKVNHVVFITIFCILMIVPFLNIFNNTNNIDVKSSHQSAQSLMSELSNVNDLYVSINKKKDQGLIFVLSSYIKGNVILYEDLSRVLLTPNDFILAFSKQEFDSINRQDDYKIIKETDGMILFDIK